MSKKYKCASYLRLSLADDNKLDESSSISSQRMIINAFAKYSNLDIVEEYVDDGFSGGNFQRPAFQRMIEDIKNGKINCVITKDLSRLGREIYQTGEYIEQYFLENGVRYIAINDSYDSEIGDTMLGIRLSVNDLYLRDVSKKVKSAMRIKQEQGEYIGSIPCYGYIKDPNNYHHLIPDEKVVPIVKMIYELALDGYGMNYICNKLSDMKIPIPIVYKGETRAKGITINDGCGVWKHATIKNILTSQMYIGNMVQHTYMKVSYHTKKLKKINDDELIIVENTHEPIISKEDFERVQVILKSRSKYTRGTKPKYLFTGLLKCKECGSTLSISEKVNKKDNSHYTQCNMYRKKGKYGVCTLHRVNYNDLEKDLLSIIRTECENFLSNYDTDELIKKSNEEYIHNTDTIKKELTIIQKQIVTSRNMIDSLYKDKLKGILSEDDFKRMYDDCTKETNINLNREKELNNKLGLLDSELSKIDYETCKKSIERFMSMEKPTRNVISGLVEKVTISQNKEVELYFRFKELAIM